ncbi:uncharacterized protein [Aquarana catesbeiana]|uniref:uncharacterized protein isoform X2 n=1 Tax=Aquarana catesbeiana TaxID=8400 RepID=UPI003CCA176B
MADIPEEVCVFCKEGEEAGSLRNTSDEDILAHYNCLLFSPGVVTIPQKDSQDNTAEFDIPSVISEINRGKKLNCSYCNKKGATVGCNNRWCRKTYHYLCVTKAKGIRIRDEDKELYIAYCYKHARKDQFAKDAQLNNGAETSGTFIPPGCSNKARKNKTPNKRKKEMEHKTARKKLRFDRMPNPGTVRKAEMRHDSDNRTNGDNMEVPGPSRTCLLHIDFYIRSDSGSDVEASDSNGSNSAQIGAEQNPGMRTEPERMHTLSDHTYHEQMKALEPSTTLQKQEHPTIVIGSDTETEDELPVFTNTKEGEGTSTKDDTPVTNTSSRLLQETLPSPARGRTSSISTDSSGPCTPEIFRSLSLSGFPKKNKKRKRKRNNPELETALLNMPHEERDVYSQLYDEVGGSLDISTYNDCDVEQIKDASNENVEDIPEDQHTDIKACSDGNNLKFAALESSVSTRTPGQFASSTPVHDATSVSQLPRYSPGVTNSPSRQFANIANIALLPTVNSHNSDVPVDQTETIHKRQSQSVAHLSPITTGTEMLIGQTSCFSLASNKCTGMSASSPRAKDAFLLKELLIKGASTSREVPPTSAGINGGKATEVQNAACNSSPLHIKALSHLPRHSPGVTSSPSGQFINIASKVKNTGSLQGTAFNLANVPYDINWLPSISGEMLTFEDSAAGENNARAQPTNTCNGKDKLVSSSAVYHPTKPLVDQPLSSSSRNKASDKQQLMKSPNNNILSEQHNKHTKNKDLVLQRLGKTQKKHEEQHFSRHAPSITLGPANTDILSDKEPLSSPSVSKTSNVQPMNPQFTSKESEEQCKQSSGFSKLSGEQSTRNVLTTKSLVHTGNSHESDVPVDRTVTVLKRQSQSVAHLSAITTVTDLLIGQTSSSSLVNNKCTEMSASSPRAKEAFPVKESLIKEAATSREEVLPTPPGIKASGTEVQNATCHPSPLHIKTFSDQLKRGVFCKTFKNITVQFRSTAKSVVTSLSKLESKEGGATTEQTSENCIVSQQTQKYLSSVDGDLRNSGQTADEPASPDKSPKDECMLVEEITHADDDTVLLYVDAGQTLDKLASPSSHQENGCKLVEEIKHVDEDTALLYVIMDTGQTAYEPASPGKPPEDRPMLVEGITHADEDTLLLYGQTSDKSASLSDLEENGPMLVTHMDEETALLSVIMDAGKTSDKPASPGDLEENECMSVEEITHTDEDPVIHSDTTNVAVLTSKSSQTETSSGFPTNVDKPMNLSIDQKIKLIESYKEAEKQMSRTGDTTKAAQAFWDLCRENRCQEFLLTLAMCYMKSVLHEIVHEEPKDRDFEQAFAFLQASGCFADFTNGIEDIQAKNNSRTTSRETCNESDSDTAGSCTDVKDQGEITRDEDPDGMESESCESSQMSNKVGQCTRDEDHNKVETEWSKTSLLSVNSNVMESSRVEDHNGMQSELCQSSLESNRKEESCRGEGHDDIQSELCESCSESSRKEEPCKGEDHDDIQNELSESSLESNRKEERCRGEDHDDIQNELSESSLESNRKEERCRGEDHDDIQNELSESSLESNRKEKSCRGEGHDDIQSELCESCSESSRKEEPCRGEDHDDIQNELSESSLESNRKEERCRGEDHDIQSELSVSLSESNRKEESSRCEDHDIIQSELCKSCSQSSRKAESCIGDGYDDIQSELCESSSERSRKKQSTESDDLDRMEMESHASSLFSPSASSKSDLVLPEDTSWRHRSLEEIQLKTMKTNLRVLKVQLQNLQYQQQQQPEDGDASFATNLIQFLRRVPEDKKLSTQMSILNVFSSVLGQQPMSISNPDCVPQQYTNPSSPRLGGQTLPPKP